MATQALMPVEEYLRKHFEREPEYRDGILEERAMPNGTHSVLQALLAYYLGALMISRRLTIATELRMQIRERRFVLPDVAIFEGRLTANLPVTPPLAVIEIISPDESSTVVSEKLAEFHRWGVRHVWLIDPAKRTLHVFDGTDLRAIDAFALPEYEVEITAVRIFEDVDKMAPVEDD